MINDLVIINPPMNTNKLYSGQWGIGRLMLLHLSLALRLIGDLALWLPGRTWGGLINVLVLLLFWGNTVTAMGKA